MWLVFGVVVLVGCGVTPITERDPEPPTGTARFSAATVIDVPVAGKTIDVSIPPTNEGDQLYVFTNTIGGAATPFIGGQRLSLDLGGLMPSCGNFFAWTWRSANLPAGFATVTFDLDQPMPVKGYILAFTGATEGHSPDFGFTRDGAVPAAAPALVAGAGTVLVSLLGTCGTAGALAADSPFTALPPLGEIDMAYYIPDEPGVYGAIWQDAGGDFVAATEHIR